jgi:predicted DNA-binding transcriptional regulator AlpA
MRRYETGDEVTVPLTIDGIEYFSATEVIKSVSTSRSTFWRWRRDGNIPRGQLLRGHKLIFTRAQVDAIREFAQRVEPITAEPSPQLVLFQSSRP